MEINNILNLLSKSFSLSVLLFSNILENSVLAASLQDSQSSTSFQERMNFIALQHSSFSTLNSLTSLGFISNKTDITTTGQFYESGFNSHISGIVNGESLDINYLGSLNGDFGEDIRISLESTGYLGSEDISTSGEMIWFYDSTTNDYFSSKYYELGQINPAWFVPHLISFGIGVVSGIAANYFYDAATEDEPERSPININIDNIENIENIENIDLSGLDPNQDINDLVPQLPMNGNLYFNSSNASGGNFNGTSTAGVPEPFTILGALTAISFGAFFKKRLS